MSTYFIGDIHGCFTELKALLAQVSFNKQVDQLWLTGDLVAYGPDSLKVLRFLYSLGPSVHMVLGNHDLHLMAIHAGISQNKPKECLNALLNAPDADDLINWLRHQPMLQVNNKLKIIMAHAGITPQWDITTAKICAREVEAVLRSNAHLLFLETMYADTPNTWTPALSGLARLRFSTNVLTRMRYCFPNGQIDMICKDAPSAVLTPLKPWFELPSLVDANYTLIFGHWASLVGQGTPKGIIGLDTGCRWGGKLTMLCWESRRYFTQQAQRVTIS